MSISLVSEVPCVEKVGEEVKGERLPSPKGAPGLEKGGYSGTLVWTLCCPQNTGFRQAEKSCLTIVSLGALLTDLSWFSPTQDCCWGLLQSAPDLPCLVVRAAAGRLEKSLRYGK